MFGSADQNVRRDPDGLQFLDRVLGWFRLQLTRSGEVGKQGEVHKNALPARFVMAELADRFEKGQALDVPDGATDFAEHEVDFIFTNGNEVFDFIRHVGNNLDGFAQVITTTFLFQNVRVDAS